MEPGYWQQRWADGRIGFHRDEVNPRLREHWHRLAPGPGERVFVPLCGKALDLPWLAGQGVTPVGVELSARAVAELFDEHGIAAQRRCAGKLECWQGGGMEIHCGDFFDLAPEEVGAVAAVWDRAALIALPADMRADYVAHCARLLPAGARLLLVTMAYADDGIAGPPFSVRPAEVESVYGPWFHVAALERDTPGDAPGDLAAQGVAQTRESVWLLQRNDETVPPGNPAPTPTAT